MLRLRDCLLAGGCVAFVISVVLVICIAAFVFSMTSIDYVRDAGFSPWIVIVYAFFCLFAVVSLLGAIVATIDWFMEP